MTTVHTFTKILIANRGEIALRVMRTCKQMGIATVAVYSDPDSDAPFVAMADEAIALGGSTAAESYLLQDKIIEAAQQTGVQAIHPGYGFLSENAGFAKKCADAGIVFIGPKPEAIDALGDKKRAKELVSKHNVPVIPGYNGADQSTEALTKAALEVGFPILLKASAGGGGKGMRIVNSEKTLTQDIEAAKREAKASFSDDTLLIEKYFGSAKHIEVQVLGDEHGGLLHFFERECSVQRRYQKVIEESPSPSLDDELRAKILEAGLNAARSINYSNAGTVEFILADNGEFYFLEVNTRLQVEHPVTEMVTGVDLVRLQIEVAEGKPLSLKQTDLTCTGNAIECRLYAEDPDNNYLPVTGKVHAFEPYESENVRFDSGVISGSEISPFYDPMIAKVIAYAPNRNEAARKLRTALMNTVFAGPVNNRAFLCRLLEHPQFLSGDFDTRFLEYHPEIAENVPLSDVERNESLIVACIFGWDQRDKARTTLKHMPSAWRSNPYQAQQIAFMFKDEEFKISYRPKRSKLEVAIADNCFTTELNKVSGSSYTITINRTRKTYLVHQADQDIFVSHGSLGTVKMSEQPRFPEPEDAALSGGYAAPMPGQIVKVCVKPGDEVKQGDALVVINSMKMENTIEAFEDGTVEEVYVEAEGFVEADTLMLKMKEKEA